MMNLQFRTVAETRPGARWKALFDRSWPAYRAWFLHDGDGARPDLVTSRKALRQYMPELEPVWEELVQLSGGDPMVARMLSLFNPTRYIYGCSQAVWTDGSPFLVRNYDFHPSACEGTFVLTEWTGTRVIASSDCLWGALDGMNEHGVCASLSFGGRRVVGQGFGIPLLLRYVLEVSRNISEAVEHLCRIPCNMAYNILLLDRSGRPIVVSLAPDRAPVVSESPVVTNHQPDGEWPAYADLNRSEEREEFLERVLGDPARDPDRFIEAFLEPPLFSDDYARGFGTLYTSLYEPGRGRVTFLWPERRWVRTFDSFAEAEFLAEYGEILAPTA